MQVISRKNRENIQLSFDLNYNFSNENNYLKRNKIKTITFPRNIKIPNFGYFQRKIIDLFRPLGINIEFKLTRKKYLEMRFIFDEMGNEDNSFQYINNFLNKKSNVSITKEEEDAFKNVIFAFAEKINSQQTLIDVHHQF